MAKRWNSLIQESSKIWKNHFFQLIRSQNISREIPALNEFPKEMRMRNGEVKFKNMLYLFVVTQNFQFKAGNDSVFIEVKFEQPTDNTISFVVTQVDAPLRVNGCVSLISYLLKSFWMKDLQIVAISLSTSFLTITLKSSTSLILKSSLLPTTKTVNGILILRKLTTNKIPFHFLFLPT